jgi:two-component system chemotaxis response regulator CheY
MEIIANPAIPVSAVEEAGHGLSVLIVDDEPHVRVYLRTMMRKLGVQATWEVGSGDAALKLYQEHQPDVVLLDVNLPHVMGTEILSRLMTLDPDAAVIVVTSDQSGDTIRAVSDLGAMGYVLKQLPPTQMQEVLAEALAQIAPRNRAPVTPE